MILFVRMKTHAQRMSELEREERKQNKAIGRAYRIGGRQPNPKQAAKIRRLYVANRTGELVDYCRYERVNPNKTIQNI